MSRPETTKIKQTRLCLIVENRPIWRVSSQNIHTVFTKLILLFNLLSKTTLCKFKTSCSPVTFNTGTSKHLDMLVIIIVSILLIYLRWFFPLVECLCEIKPE